MKTIPSRNNLCVYWILICVFAMFSCSMWGQSGSANISGVVADSSGAVIPGATVVVSNQATGLKRTVKSDGEGRYQVLALPVGTYSVTVDATGFKQAVAENLVLQIQEAREVDVKLATAGTAQTVQVDGSAVTIQTSDATVGQVVGAEQVAKLPLNGRDFVQLATLVPGTAQGSQGFFNNRGQGEVAIRGTVSLAVAGMRENDNDWRLDGIDNNELTAGAISILPSIDAIQEFKVQTFNYAVQYGARGGATVLVTTKSGTNTMHGVMFEFLRNDKLDARNYFDGPVKPVYVQNQFGGTLGGPIRKDKTFYFLSYEGERVHQGLTILSTVPTALQKQGIFTESFAGVAAPVIYDPSTTAVDPATGVNSRTAFQDNTIPSARIDRIGQAIMNFYPDPTFTDRQANNYLSNPVRTMSDNAGIARVDHQFSPKDSFFTRFAEDYADQYYPGGLPGFAAGGGGSFNTTFNTVALNLVLSETHIFNSNTLSVLTAGYNRDYNRFSTFGLGSNEAAKLGIPGANLGPIETSQMSSVGLNGGFDALGTRPYSPYQGGTNVFDYAGTLSHIHGAQTFTAGFEYRAMLMNTIGNFASSGEFNFDNNFTAQITPTGGFDGSTGSSLASLLLGLPALTSHDYQFFGYVTGRRWKEFRGFFQDDWKVNPRLTFNVGLAYSVMTPIAEAHGRQANFDPSTNTLLIPGQNAGKYAGVTTDLSDIQPRLGFAWTPGNNSKTAIRGGYGIFYDDAPSNGTQGLYQNPPFATNYTYTSDDLNTGVTIDGGFPIITKAPSLANYEGNLVLWQKDYKQGLIEQWNLNIQRETVGNTLLSITYAGTRASRLQVRGLNTDTATPGPGINPADRRPFPEYASFNLTSSRGMLRYDALLLSAEKRTSHGVYFLASYTYSKAFENGLQQNVGSSGPGIIYYPLNVFPKEDKGLAMNDLTHNFSFSALYQLPFGSGKKWLSGSHSFVAAIASNWETNLIEHLRTGYPLNFSMASNQSGTDLGNRPLVTCDPQLPRNRRVPTEEFNTSCFAAPPVGTLGIAPRTVGRGPNQADTDFAIDRTFPFGKREGTDLEFRGEIFNIFNTAQFDLPNTTFGSVGFGQSSDTVQNSRQIQFALKIHY
jgi:Carboxypeptidase regulatory-like domain